MRSISPCLVFPLGLGLAREPMVRNGSFDETLSAAVVSGSRRAARLPRCERTNRSPLAMRRRTDCAFWRNSSIVIVFIYVKFNFKLSLWQEYRHSGCNKGWFQFRRAPGRVDALRAAPRTASAISNPRDRSAKAAAVDKTYRMIPRSLFSMNWMSSVTSSV